MAVIINGTGDQTVFLDYDNYKVGGCSARSEGNNAYLNVKIPGEDIRLASNFTIEGWFYLDAAWATVEGVAMKHFIAINGDPTTIEESQDGIDFSSDDPDFWVGYYNDQASLYTPNPVLQVGFKEVDSEENHRLNYYWEMPTEQWIHIAVVRNNNQIRLYINGQETTSAQYSGNQLLNYIPVDEGIETSPSSLYDQYPNAGDYAFDTNVRIGLDYHGNFDEFRIRNGAVYTSNFTPSTTPFEPSLISDILLLHFEGNFEDDIYNVKAASELSAAFSSTVVAGTIAPVVVDLSASTAVSVEGGIITLGELSMSAATEQTVSSGMVYGSEFAVESSTQQTTQAAVTLTGELVLDGVLSADANIVGLLGSDIVADAAFSTQVAADIIIDSSADITTNAQVQAQAQLTLATTVETDATFEQTTAANKIVWLVAPSDWATYPTWDEWLVWANTFDLPATFEQTTEAGFIEELFGDVDLSSTFSTAAESSVSHQAAAAFEGVFESYVSVDGRIPGSADLTATFEQTSTAAVDHFAEVDLTSASTFESTITGTRPGDIDVSGSFNVAVEENLTLDTTIANNATFEMTATLGYKSDAYVDYEAAFGQTTNAQTTLAGETALNTTFTTTAEATRVVYGEVEATADWSIQTDQSLQVAADLQASSEFVADIDAENIVNGEADWTALTAQLTVAEVIEPNLARTLIVASESRVANITSETRTLKVNVPAYTGYRRVA